jgi:hypothetical protein
VVAEDEEEDDDDDDDDEDDDDDDDDEVEVVAVVVAVVVVWVAGEERTGGPIGNNWRALGSRTTRACVASKKALMERRT